METEITLRIRKRVTKFVPTLLEKMHACFQRLQDPARDIIQDMRIIQKLNLVSILRMVDATEIIIDLSQTMNVRLFAQKMTQILLSIWLTNVAYQLSLVHASVTSPGKIYKEV